MPTLTEQQVREALQAVKFPGFSRDIVSFGLVKSIAITPTGDVTVTLNVVTRDPAVPPQIRHDADIALRSLPGIGRVMVELTTQTPTGQPATAAPTQPNLPKIDGVKYIIAVGSGKGGVGKSTVAVNIACALSQLGRRVGVMDADIYGPSIPKMMSMALLLDHNQPVIWRGPMIMKAIQEFSHAVNWGTLDVLLVDLPPGTGDAQLSLAQTLALDGGVIVTTPQDVALEVARRGIAMFEKVNVKILGIVENMSYYMCPHCGKRDDVFGHGGGEKEARRLNVPFLGAVPLFTEVRECGDAGQPVVVAKPKSQPAEAFRQCAATVWQQLIAH